MLRNFWGPDFEANFKRVVSYIRYKISVYTADSGYLIDQTIYCSQIGFTIGSSDVAWYAGIYSTLKFIYVSLDIILAN